LPDKRRRLVAKAGLQREAIAAMIEDQQELAGLVEGGIAAFRWAKAHKYTLLAGVVGVAVARPRRVLRWASQAWAIYRLVNNLRRSLTPRLM
jgi:hypothetical protein